MGIERIALKISRGKCGLIKKLLVILIEKDNTFTYYHSKNLNFRLTEDLNVKRQKFRTFK